MHEITTSIHCDSCFKTTQRAQLEEAIFLRTPKVDSAKETSQGTIVWLCECGVEEATRRPLSGVLEETGWAEGEVWEAVTS